MPESYRPPIAADEMEKKKKRTMSQTSGTNLARDNATVDRLLESKGGEVYSIGPDDSIADAVRLLRDKRVGALVVVDGEGALQGILSERDIVRKLAETPGQTLPQKVSENMTREVVTCAPEETLVSALRRMTAGRFRHMPVVEDGALKGMITIGDVVGYRLSEVEHEALQLKQMIVG
jgi:CBS domain-containing protein